MAGRYDSGFPCYFLRYPPPFSFIGTLSGECRLIARFLLYFPEGNPLGFNGLIPRFPLSPPAVCSKLFKIPTKRSFRQGTGLRFNVLRESGRGADFQFPPPYPCVRADCWANRAGPEGKYASAAFLPGEWAGNFFSFDVGFYHASENIKDDSRNFRRKPYISIAGLRGACIHALS